MLEESSPPRAANSHSASACIHTERVVTVCVRVDQIHVVVPVGKRAPRQEQKATASS